MAPKVEDIQPTIPQDDSMFDWDDIFEKSDTPDLFSDIPLSLGSPDSGHGSDFIGSDSEIFSNMNTSMDTFSIDTADLNTLSPSSDSLDLTSDKFLSEFLTF